MSTPFTPPGQFAPAEVVDSTHHSAWIIIATALGLILLFVSLLIRCYVRYTVGAISQASDVILVGAAAACASDILYLMTLYTSKCCVGVTYRHLSPDRNHKQASLVVMALSTLWLISSIFMIAVNCELNKPWVDIAAQCSNLFLRWQIIAALDMTTEVCLYVVAIYIIAGRKMPLKAKATVLLAFGLRLPVIAAAAIRLHSINTTGHSFDPTLVGANVVIWTQVELYYSIIACSTYSWKPFMAALSTNHRTVAVDVENHDRTNGSSQSGYGPGSQLRSGSSFGLSSMNKAEEPETLRGAKEKRVIVNTKPLSQQDPHSNWTTVIGGPEVKRDIGSSGSSGSRRLIIRKHIEYEVAYSQEIRKDEKPTSECREVSLTDRV